MLEGEADGEEGDRTSETSSPNQLTNKRFTRYHHHQAIEDIHWSVIASIQLGRLRWTTDSTPSHAIMSSLMQEFVPDLASSSEMGEYAEPFKKGDRVEVSLEKDGDYGVWFPATVLQYFPDDKSYMVCHWCRKDGAEDSSQKSTVSSQQIRPQPPLNRKSFKLLDTVDAFYDFSWTTGVIINEVKDKNFEVSFQRTEKKMVLNEAKLRSHVEWVDGRWIDASRGIWGHPFFEGDVLNMIVPHSFRSSLKKIRIANFEGRPEETEMVKFLLENATVLERMLIYFSDKLLLNPEKLIEISHHVEVLPRGSDRLIIYYSDWLLMDMES